MTPPLQVVLVDFSSSPIRQREVDIASSNLARPTKFYTLIFFAGKLISDLKYGLVDQRITVVKDRHLGMVEVPSDLFSFKRKKLNQKER